MLELAVNVSACEKTVPVAPRFNVPAPEKTIWQPVVPQVTGPETVRVPVEMVITLLRPEVVALIVSEPQETVPDPTVRVVVPPVLGLGMVIAPLMVSELLPLIATVVPADTVA